MRRMMSEDGWKELWDGVISRSPYRAFKVQRSRLVQHWDEVSRDYDTDSMSLIDERIWELLERMSAVPPGGRALDVGCGTGALTARLASSCSGVLGLDFSPGMLSVARERCSRLGNVELLCSGWEEYSAGRDFDLVFSSFCPAVDDLSSVLKMDSLSKDRCCIISLGGSSGDRLAFDIWEELGHPGLTMDGFDPEFPRRLLEEMGGEPQLRSFGVREETVIRRQDMVRHLARYFSLFHPVDGRVMQAIERKVGQRSRGGLLTLVEDRTVSVLVWKSLGARSAPW